MSSAEGYDFAVVEAHAAEDGAEVRLLFGAIGESTIRRAGADITVGAAWAPGYGGTLHFLDCGHAGEGPEVGVGYPREIRFDWLKEVASSFEAGVGAMITFGSETHSGAIGAASVGCFVVATSCISY